MVIVGLILLGLCFGSFINALVWRVYMQSKKENIKSKKELEKYSITKGRSMCTHCGHALSSKDLVPVFSWLFLGGKCRYCHKKIEDSPVIEVVMSLLFVGSYIFWHNELSGLEIVSFGLWLAILTGLMALVVYDFRWMILPNKIVFKLYALTALFVILEILKDISPSVLLSILLSIVIGGGLFYLLFQISKGKWIGGGDVKLGFLLGALCLHPANSFLMLFLASVLGVLYIVPRMPSGKVKKNTRIPFGPFLIFATIIVVLFGNQIIDWYLSKVLMLY